VGVVHVIMFAPPSMDVSTPNIFSFFFFKQKSGTLVVVAHVWEVGLSQSTQIINNGTTTFA